MTSKVLDPIDRNSEILFGLFMVLTFTGTLSVASAGREEVRAMMIAAFGCNVAWGLVDAMMYVLRSIVARGRQARLVREVRDSDRPKQAHALIAQEMGSLAGAQSPQDFERMRQWVVSQPPAAIPSPRLTGNDLRAGVGVFVLVFASTVPAVLPFVFFKDLRTAMRVSGAIAIVIMFLCGYEWGRYAGLRPLRSAMWMVLLGVGIELVIIALGG